MKSVFLSYTSTDKHFVRRLAADLQSRDCEVWFDEWVIKAGDSIVQKIQNGIADSQYLLVILSQKSVSSPWVTVELDAAFFEQTKSRSITVIPIVIDDCEVPPLLKARRYADFRKDYELGLDELLLTFESDHRAGPLDGLELRILREAGSEGGYSWWRETVSPTREQDAHDRAVARLSRLDLVSTRPGRSFGCIDSGANETICEITERGRRRLTRIEDSKL